MICDDCELNPQCRICETCLAHCTCSNKEDFDEDTLQSNEVIEPIRNLRENKQKSTLNSILNEYFKSNKKDAKRYQEYFKAKNVFVISREMFDKTPDQMVEAWFTKFDQVFIDDSKNPYIPLYTKKEVAVHIAKKFNKENLDKGIGMIHKMTNDISKFANSLNFDTSGSNKKRGKVKF